MEDNRNKVNIKLVRYEDEIIQNEQKKWKVRVLVAFIVGVLLTSTVMIVLRQTGSPLASTNQFDKLDKVYQVMDTQWYFGKDVENLSEKLKDFAIKGMLEKAGDQYTSYMDAEEAKAYNQSLSGSYEGIGVSYRKEADRYRIIRVFNESPAQKAGVKSGDIISKVDGVDVTTIEQDEISKMVRGKGGTTVNIEVIRGLESINFDIVRGQITYTAYGEIREEAGKRIGYLEIMQFASTTYKEVDNILTQFKSEGIEYLIIDLRDNPGGYLDSVTKIVDLFIGKDKIILQEIEKDGKILTHKSTKDIVYSFKDLVILMNEHSASAAEVMASAMNENEGYELIGMTTYGKGTVQTSTQFKDGSILKYTKAEWLDANGEPLNKIGVIPTYEVQSLYSSLKIVEYTNDLKVDSVDEQVKNMQLILKAIGYPIDRTDGYFSTATEAVLKQFQADQGAEANGILTKETLQLLMDQVYRQMDQPVYDRQYQEAVSHLE